MCFDSEEDAADAVEQHRVPDQTVMVIRYEGPKGGPGMREMVRIMKKLYGQGKALTTAVVTDGRFSGSNNGCFVGHISPEAASGGPIAYARDGDWITIDIPDGTLHIDVTEEEFARRRNEGLKEHPLSEKGYLARYARLVGSAAGGAIVGEGF
jgi:dihydroxy-acid dehydratase